MPENIEPTINIKSFNDEPVIKKLEVSKKKIPKINLLIFSLAVILGIVSGYSIYKFSGKTTSGGISTQTNTSKSSGKIAVGTDDKTQFPDTAEGTLEQGGIKGEGTHKLIRPGGENQTVYITSSVVDLDQFVGKKVKIWGKTYASAHAGWFMDVGKVETL